MSRTSGAMPKRLILSAVLLACVAVACSYNANPYGTVTTPTPSPTGTYSPNPNITSATVEVQVQNIPQAGATVSEATPGPGGHVTGATPFAQATTGPRGTVVFPNLTPGQAYCWWYVASPTETASNCTQFWQTATIQLSV